MYYIWTYYTLYSLPHLGNIYIHPYIYIHVVIAKEEAAEGRQIAQALHASVDEARVARILHFDSSVSLGKEPVDAKKVEKRAPPADPPALSHPPCRYPRHVVAEGSDALQRGSMPGF